MGNRTKNLIAKPNGTKGFTVAELSVIFVVLGFITILVLKNASQVTSAQYSVKFNKIAADINSNIERGIVSKTGFRFEDYNNNNAMYVADVTDNLNVSPTTMANDWSKTTTIRGNDISGYSAFRFDNEAVLAISNTNTDIYVDVNGSKGPNKLEKDIYKFRSAYEDQIAMRPGQNIAIIDPVEGGGCTNPGHPDTNAIWTYTEANCTWTPSCNGNKNLSGNSCVCKDPTTKSDSTYTYTINSTTCEYSKTSCVNDKKNLVSGSCVCKDPTTKSDSTYTYTINSTTCEYSKSGCVQSGYTLSNGTCIRTCTAAQINSYLIADYDCCGAGGGHYHRNCKNSDRKAAACSKSRQTCKQNCPNNTSECNSYACTYRSHGYGCNSK